MLASLRIKNFAIVAELELEFNANMTAFTGETGAGKSIMIDALMLALGGRAEASMIRPGASQCDITACFQIEQDSDATLWLQDHDIPCDDGEVFLRRVLYPEGRSKSSINGLPFPIQKIKELSHLLVDIHGQHQHQSLLNHQTHRDQLDAYAEHQPLLDTVKRHYQQCVKIKNEWDALQQGPHTSAERMALLRYQIDELEQLKLVAGELQALHEEHQMLHHAHDYLTESQRITGLLREDEPFNMAQAIHQTLHALSKLPQDNPAIQHAVDFMNNVRIQCDEALDEIAGFHRTILLDPKRLQDVEARMSLLHQVARKYHIEAQQLPETLGALQAELSQLQQSDTEIQRLQAAYDVCTQQYETAAHALRASREQKSGQLANDIGHHIQQLGMPKGFIEVRFTPLEKMQPHGLDKVEYYVCTNPGLLPDTLNKVASGGELSRLSLAIQLITATRSPTKTLLFDEVDVGIGGTTAALVGQMLRKLGERMQVFCVTHQAQVASSAHHHFLVEKHMSDSATFSRVTPLTLPEKVTEIARMLGGLTMTEQTLLHARELLNASCL